METEGHTTTPNSRRPEQGDPKDTPPTQGHEGQLQITRPLPRTEARLDWELGEPADERTVR